MTCLSSLQAFALRTGAVSFLVLVLFGAANAYTIVKRDGRRIEIPSEFVVTSRTLTYEVSPGIQITLQLRTIDISATERANNEAPGAFMRRAQAQPVAPQNLQSSSVAPSEQERSAVRTITNKDLRAAKARREQSELAYGQRLKQLGLPSLDESRARTAAESETIQRELGGVVASKRQEENYWRGRARDLRIEIASVDAEMSYVRLRLEQLPAANSVNGITTVTTSPYPWDWGRRGGYRRNRQSGVWIGNGNPGVWNGSYGYPQYPGAVILGSPYPQYDSTYERSELTTRFNELAGKRAGLVVRWNALESDARRAGVPPGWLRE